MAPKFCVSIVNNAHWFVQDFGNDNGKPRLCWTNNPAEAQRFDRHLTAVALAQIVKHTHPGVNVRLLEIPCTEAPHDSNPA